MFKVNTYDFVNFRLLIENRKAMQTLKEELKDENAKPRGLDESKLENREDREEIQGRKKYPSFTKYVKKVHVCTILLEYLQSPDLIFYVTYSSLKKIFLIFYHYYEILKKKRQMSIAK